MRMAAVFMSLLWLLVAIRQIPADDAKKDFEQLQGSWEIQAWTYDGTPIPSEDERENTLVIIKGDVLVLERKKDKVEFTFYQLLPIKKAGEIDLIPQNGRLKGKTVPGIYKRDGDTLMLCHAQSSRPTEYKGDAGSKQTLWILRRSKL